MLDDPEVEGHRHKTGHARADFILGGLAVFLSIVSIFIAVRHGETMERLVAANSWPNLSYYTGNVTDDGRNEIHFTIRNTGVGPARIDSLELFYKDKPIASSSALLAACCGEVKPNYGINDINDVVLPAREAMSFIELRQDQNSKAMWDMLDKERFNVRVRACYCSVFDECWVLDSRQHRPERADRCEPSQPVQYKD